MPLLPRVQSTSIFTENDTKKEHDRSLSNSRVFCGCDSHNPWNRFYQFWTPLDSCFKVLKNDETSSPRLTQNIYIHARTHTRARPHRRRRNFLTTIKFNNNNINNNSRLTPNKKQVPKKKNAAWTNYTRGQNTMLDTRT